MPVKKYIFIFGDSITYGEWDELGGWANRIRRHFDNAVLPIPNDYIVTYNLGIPSDTSSGLCLRLEHETHARLTPNPSVRELQFIISIGTNDSRWLVEENKIAISKQQFQSNLITITDQAKKYSNNIVFVGILPCDEKEVASSAAKHLWVESYYNDSLFEYNNVVKKHCIDENLTFIDIHCAFLDKPSGFLLSDGLHPNSQGHALLAELILQGMQ